MTINIIPFDFNEHPIRVVDDMDHAWFVAADVARALDYREAKDMTRNLDDDEKGRHIVPTPSGDQNMLVINESGLYHAVLKSRKPSAKKFRKWVTAEVLPAIRRTGRYETPKPETLTPAQQRHIQNRVAQLVREQVGTTYKMIWAQIKNHFKVGSYKDIPAARYPDVCAYLKCQPIFLSKTEDEQLFLDDLSAEHSAELKKALESQGIERLLVVIEKGRLALVKNIQGFSIVDAQGYRTVRRNMQMLNKQFNWLSGDEGMESLDLEFESLH